jgi:hypothetical protein
MRNATMSPHAHALATALIESEDHLVALPIPSARLAEQEGMGVADWTVFRAQELTSSGIAIEELRRDG